MGELGHGGAALCALLYCIAGGREGMDEKKR
jgi:hypothetical protein